MFGKVESTPQKQRVLLVYLAMIERIVRKASGAFFWGNGYFFEGKCQWHECISNDQRFGVYLASNIVL